MRYSGGSFVILIRDIVVLLETKMGEGRMKAVREMMGFWGGVGFGAQGASGGMCLWWRKRINLDIWRVAKN